MPRRAGPVRLGRSESGTFTRSLAMGTSWMLLAQVFSRASRLITTLIVARLLAPEHFGTVAIAMTAHEIALVVSRFATTTALIRCSDIAVARLCRSAWSVNWAVAIILFSIQWVAADLVAIAFSEPAIIWPIRVLAIVYLLLPLGAVNQALTARRGDMKTIASVDLKQALGDTLLTVTLALSGFGLWSLILPKLLVVPVWIAAHRRASPWTCNSGSSITASSLLKEVRKDGPWLVQFGSKVASVELLSVMRHSIDYIIVGIFLGIEALGVYFFAFNAGLGITRSIIAACNAALLPALCRADDNGSTQTRNFELAATGILILVSLWIAVQVCFAHWYVPIIFGEQWVEHGAVPVLTTLCLCGIPLALTEAGSQYLRATDSVHDDLKWSVRYTTIFVPGILVGVQWGIEGVATALVAVSCLSLPLYYLTALRPALERKR